MTYEQLKTSLEKNPMALGKYSDEIRNYPALVLVAISRNNEASKYVGDRLKTEIDEYLSFCPEKSYLDAVNCFLGLQDEREVFEV